MPDIDKLFEKLEEVLKAHNPDADLELIRKAYYFAREAHKEQLRKSGEPYIIHPINVGINLAELNMDSRAIAAGFLHDVLEDTAISREEIRKNFGEEVADTVYRVSDEPGTKREEKKQKTYPKIRDHYRATVVKLCDRIANVEASINNPKKLNMYKAEHPAFRSALYIEKHSVLQKLWDLLDQLLGFGCNNKPSL